MVPSVLPLSHSASSPICFVFFVAIIVTHLVFFRLFGLTFSFTKNLLSHCIDLVQLCLVTLLFPLFPSCVEVVVSFASVFVLSLKVYGFV